MSSRSSLTELLDWCLQNDIVIDHRLGLCYDENKGVHVKSGDASIPSNTTLVRIPKEAVLSVKSCSFSQYVPFELHGLGAQLGLSFALYMEILKGKSSRWYGYLQSFTAVDLPVFWDHHPPPPQPVVWHSKLSHDSVAWLHGTEAMRLLLRPQDQLTLSEHITEYHQRVVMPTIEKHDLRRSLVHEPSLGAFQEAYSLVSSRAFMLDVYHGLSMTPIADAFNHVQENQVHLESDFYVCPECGSLRECAHDRDHIGSEDADVDHSGHDFWYEMVANADIQPNEEIFNTYGEDLTNAQLFVQYGFILDPNDNDTLNFDLDEVLLANLPSDGTWRMPSFDLTVHNSFSTLFRHSRLVFEAGSIHSETAFCINSDGRISWSLWIFLVKIVCQNLFLADYPKGVEGKDLDDIAAIQLELEDVSEDDGVHNSRTSAFVSRNRSFNVLSKVAEAVVHLCASRAEAIGVPGTAEEDLGVFLDGIPQSMTRLRLALSIVINERSILDSCKFNWIDLLELLKRIKS